MVSLRIQTCLIIALLAFGPSCLVAQESSLRFRGFSTIGITYDSSDQLRFRRDFSIKSGDQWSFKTDSLIGGQINVDITPKWDAMVQGILQDRVSDDPVDYLEWAFIRYRFNRNWSVRAGRLRGDMYLLSEYKPVGYAYLWARPPVEFYSPTVFVSGVNGFDVQYSTNFLKGFLQAKITYGSTGQKLEGAGDKFAIDFNKVLISNIEYSQNQWKVKISYAEVSVDKLESSGIHEVHEALEGVPAIFWPGIEEIGHNLGPPHHGIYYIGLGYQYENDTWLLQTELGSYTSDWTFVSHYQNGYISIGYKNGKATYFSTLSEIYPKAKAEQVPPLNILPGTPSPLVEQLQLLHEGVTRIVNSPQMRQKTISFGVRWMISEKTSIKLQVDRTRVHDNGYFLWGETGQVNSQQLVTLVSTNINLVF